MAFGPEDADIVSDDFWDTFGIELAAETVTPSLDPPKTEPGDIFLPGFIPKSIGPFINKPPAKKSVPLPPTLSASGVLKSQAEFTAYQEVWNTKLGSCVHHGKPMEYPCLVISLLVGSKPGGSWEIVHTFVFRGDLYKLLGIALPEGGADPRDTGRLEERVL